MTAIDDVLPIILGAGGAGFIAAVVQALSSWRNGVEQREGRAVANLERWRVEADDRADRRQALLETQYEAVRYWRSWAGHLEYLLEAAGQPVPERPTPYPPAPQGGMDEPPPRMPARGGHS